MNYPVKQLKYEDDARESLMKGVNAVARAVITTMGPRGRNVALDEHWMNPPKVIHDGVSVAEKIFLEDRFENMGAQLVKEAARKTNDQAGDGTTTATLFTQQIAQLGMEAIKAHKANPMFLKRGIDKAISVVVKELIKLSKPVKKDDWERVATISAQNEKIGKKISEALKLVGKGGLIEVEEGAVNDIEVAHTGGMELDKGYLSDYFVNDRSQNACVLENPFIVISDMKISSPQPLLELMKKAKNAGRPILFIADNIDGEALATLVINHIKGNLVACAVQAPSIASTRAEILEDLAVFTKGRVISSTVGLSLEKAELEDCGMADKVIITKDSTKIINGHGTKEAVQDRVNQIKGLLDQAGSEHEQVTLAQRIGKLSKGVAIVKVGAATQTEMDELRERVKDAVGATKAAIEEGVVVGGGISYLKVKKALTDLHSDNPDEERGIQIVLEALSKPIYWLVKNSGGDPDEVLENVQSNTQVLNYGFNVATMQYGDLMEQNVIEPVKVCRLALTNGASAASMILTTECCITDKPQEESSPQEN